MNVNISLQFMRNFQGNNAKSETTSNSSETNGFFDGLQSITSKDELDTNIDLENEDVENALDLALIQNVLSNIQLNTSTKEMISSLDTVSMNISNGEFVSDKFIDQNTISQLISTEQQTNLDISNNEVVSTIINSEDGVELKDFVNKNNSSQNLNLETMVEKNAEIKIENSNDKQSSNQNDTENELLSNENSEANSKTEQKEQGYKELELNSLMGRKNIQINNKLNPEDKELNTLEGILDTNENSFIISNNFANNVSEVSTKESINQQPISNIRQEFIGEDIVKTITYLKSNGMEEIKIKISPRELGDMTIKLIKSAEDTKVMITLSKEDIFELVNKNIGEITKHLNELNINVKEVSVDVKSDNQKFFSDNLNQESNKKNHENKNKSNKGKKFEDENIEEVTKKKAEDNINILI